MRCCRVREELEQQREVAQDAIKRARSAAEALEQQQAVTMARDLKDTEDLKRVTEGLMLDADDDVRRARECAVKANQVWGAECWRDGVR